MSKIPEEIGKYKILSCLGSGGTSIVYTATHPTLKRKVVLKKLNLRGNKQHYERFRQEAALMMDLNHDNIVRVFDHFKEGSRHYIVMEFVEGCSLDEVLRKGGALPPGACRLILESCCKAIEYIHSRNIIHRDIKPSNIFISHSGEVKLGDFGIAQLEREGEMNGESLPLGTPSYMAPEQFLPHGKITKRTDIYALGVSLYEMLTAEKLFTGSTLDDLKKKILKSRHDPLLPLIFSKGFPLYWIVRKSSFRSPSLRFATIKSLRRVLKFATPKVRNHDARAVLQLLVESAAGVKKSGKKKNESQPVLPEHQSIGRRGKVFWFSLAVVLVLGALFSYSFMNGSFYRLFFQKNKGAVQIRVVSRDITFPHAGDLHLYRDKSLYLDSVKEVDLSGGIGISDIYYLDTGNYRIMVRWGSQVEWILFYLPPMAQQEGVLIVDVEREDIPRKPLTIQSYLVDALNGRDLSAESVVSVQKNGMEWIPVDDLFLLTGEAYRMKVECKGYYPRYLNVPLQFYQDLLVLRIQMVPLPGTLSIDHDMQELSLLVNGKKRITGGSEEKELLQFGRIPAGRQEWMLSPGVYTLHFQSEGAVLETELMVDSFGEYHYTLQFQNDKLIMTPY